MSSRSLACISSMRPTFSFLSLTEFMHLRRGLELARIDAGEGQRADERVVHDLERQRRERRVVRRRAGVGRLAVQLEAFDRRDVERARQIVDDRVEQRLDALVLERRAAQHRHEREVERALADQLLQRRDVGLIAFEIGFHDVVVLLDGHLDQLLASGRGGVRRGRPGSLRRRTSRRGSRRAR